MLVQTVVLETNDAVLLWDAANCWHIWHERTEFLEVDVLSRFFVRSTFCGACEANIVDIGVTEH